MYGSMFTAPIGTACLKFALEYFGLPTSDFTEDELAATYIPDEKLYVLEKHIMICPE